MNGLTSAQYTESNNIQKEKVAVHRHFLPRTENGMRQTAWIMYVFDEFQVREFFGIGASVSLKLKLLVPRSNVSVTCRGRAACCLQAIPMAAEF